MKCYKLLLHIILPTIFAFLLCGTAHADLLHLHTGEIIDGQILQESGIFVRVQSDTASGSITREYLRDNIIRIEKGKSLKGTPLKKALSTLKTQQRKFERKVNPYARRADANTSKVVAVEEALTGSAKQTSGSSKGVEVITNESLNQFLGQRVTQSNAQISQEQMAMLETQLNGYMQSTDVKAFIWQFIAGILVGIFFFLGVAGAIGYFVAKKYNRDDENEVTQPAGFWRRLMARIIDFYVGMCLLMFLYMLPGIIIALDNHFMMLMFCWLLPLMLLFFWYYYFGITRLKNTYGRYVMGIKVQDLETGEKPTLGQAFKRDFIGSILVLIEAFVIIFNKKKRRIGDYWSGTYSCLIKTSDPWFKRIAPGALIIALFYIFAYSVSPLVNNRMNIGQTARHHLEGRYGKDMVGHPARVEIVNYKGYVTFGLKNDRNVGVQLKKIPDGWAVEGVTIIDKKQLGNGFSLQYGS